jgi:hypothetical protein
MKTGTVYFSPAHKVAVGVSFSCVYWGSYNSYFLVVCGVCFVLFVFTLCYLCL